MPEHVDAPLGEIHIPHNYEYANAAARLAATGFAAGDVGKLARQTDDNTLWMLTDDSPVTWLQVGGGGTLANDSVANAALANMAQGTVKGRASGAGTGDPTDLSAAQVKTILAIVPGDVTGFDTQVRTSRLDQMAAPTADVSLNSHKLTNVTDPGSAQDAATKAYVDAQITGGGATVANDSITNAKLANMAQATIKGRASGAGTGDPTDLSAAQVKTILGLAGSDISNTPAGGIAATDVQAAINELDTEKLTQAQADALYEPLGGGGGGAGTRSYVLLPAEYPSATSTAGIGSANQVRVFRFYLAADLTVNRIAFRFGAQSGNNCAVGVYSDDGNTKLIDSGAIAIVANTLSDIALGAPVALTAGHYWLAYTMDNTTPTIHVVTLATAIRTVLNATTVQTGTAANASASAVLPATLGAITSADVSVPVVKLQN